MRQRFVSKLLLNAIHFRIYLILDTGWYEDIRGDMMKFDTLISLFWMLLSFQNIITSQIEFTAHRMMIFKKSFTTSFRSRRLRMTPPSLAFGNTTAASTRIMLTL